MRESRQITLKYLVGYFVDNGSKMVHDVVMGHGSQDAKSGKEGVKSDG